MGFVACATSRRWPETSTYPRRRAVAPRPATASRQIQQLEMLG
ncbi:hypothetical protein ACPA9J_02135 [Pseudomonas aeruginosa]